MADSAVVVGVTGIVVSGVVGPTVAALIGRRTRFREFHREQVVNRRNELRKVLDDAASLLAVGPTNIRVLREAGSGDEVERARTWLSQVFPIGQRLQLWLPADHLIVVSYEQVRERLVEAAAASSPAAANSLLDEFERVRRSFLDSAREAMLSPVPETGAAL